MNKNHKRTVKVNNIEIGGGTPVIMAGPCSIESREQIIEDAKIYKEIGIDFLRGGAFKPRTSPLDFQGVGMKGIDYMVEASQKTDIPIITEVLSEEHVDTMADKVDIFQIGSRNMYNYALLRKVARTGKPVLLKRGLSATLHEWAMAAKYIKKENNPNIILCERGIRTFETATRNTLDLAGAVLIQKQTGYPVIVDPSHGTGVRELIEPMVKATLALDLDGIMVEVHKNPDQALSDGHQTIDYDNYREIVKLVRGY